MTRVIKPALSLIIEFAILLFNSHLMMTKWWSYWKILLMNHRSFMITRHLFASFYKSSDKMWNRMRKSSEFVWLSMMPERLMKRKEKLSIEMKNFSNIIKFLTFINININDITFSVSQKLDVRSWDIIAINDDNDTLL